MNYESYERIKVERKGRILTLSLNRPDHLNAIDDPMHEELARIFHDVQIDDEADVIVLTGGRPGIQRRRRHGLASRAVGGWNALHRPWSRPSA